MMFHDINVDGVTDEIVQHAVDIVDRWYTSKRVDWSDVWNRLDGIKLGNGLNLDLDLGDNLVSPGLKKLRDAVVRARRENK